ISPKRVRSRPMRWSRSAASFWRCASSPSSQAMRNWRPLMVTLTCGMEFPLADILALIRRKHGTDGVDRGIEPLRNLAVGRLQPPRARRGGIKLGSEPRAVGAERVQLGIERLLAAIGLLPPLDRGGQCIERKRKALAGGIDGADVVHAAQPSPE